MGKNKPEKVMNGFKYIFTDFAEIVPEGLTVLCVVCDFVRYSQCMMCSKCEECIYQINLSLVY